MLQRFKKFGELSFNEQLLFYEACFLQLTIGLLLKIIPFRWIPRLFSSPKFEAPTQEKSRTRSVGKEAQSRPRSESGQQSIINRKSQIANRKSETSSLIPIQIKQAIQRSGRVSPWRNKCLIQSLAARRMLNRRKIQSQLSLGITKGENSRMIAHAWLKVNDFEIVEKSGDYTELYLF